MAMWLEGEKERYAGNFDDLLVEVTLVTATQPT
jgi:hypothetical protein